MPKSQVLVQVQFQPEGERVFLRLEFYDAAGKPVPSGAFMLLPEVAGWLMRRLGEQFDVDIVEVDNE